MTDNNYTHLEVIVDRSGSMSNIVDDMEGGFATFLKEQRDVEGRMTVSITTFNTQAKTEISMTDISKVDGITINPAGGTALYDAIGTRIKTLGAQLKAMPESMRPGLVTVVIITDGEENSSREFNAADIKAMIDHQEEVYQWTFVYLGANQDAFAAGTAFGMKRGATMDYLATKAGVNNMYSGLTKGIAKVRRMKAGGQSVFSADVLSDEQDEEIVPQEVTSSSN